MSRGPGRLELAILATFDAEPENAFTVEDLCELAYPRSNVVEKKHRVAVIRALRRVVARSDEIETIEARGIGGTLIAYSRYVLLSYAMAQLKADPFHRYRQKAMRRGRWRIRGRAEDRSVQEDMLRRNLLPGGEACRHVVEGGDWHRNVAICIAQRDGARERVEHLERQREEADAAWLEAGRRLFSGNT